MVILHNLVNWVRYRTASPGFPVCQRVPDSFPAFPEWILTIIMVWTIKYLDYQINQINRIYIT